MRCDTGTYSLLGGRVNGLETHRRKFFQKNVLEELVSEMDEEKEQREELDMM